MIVFAVLTYFNISRQFLLKHYNKNSYIAESDPAAGRLVITEGGRNKAIDFKIETNPKGSGFFSPTNKSKILDVAEKSQVILYSKHGGSNQRFQLIYLGPDKYAIVNREKCLTLDTTSFHYMRSCTYQNDQLYTVVHNQDEKKQLVTSDDPSHIYGDINQANFMLLNKLSRMMDSHHSVEHNHPSYLNYNVGNPHSHYDDEHFNDHDGRHLIDRHGDFLTHFSNGHHSHHYDEGFHGHHYDKSHHHRETTHGHHHNDSHNSQYYKNVHDSHGHHEHDSHHNYDTHGSHGHGHDSHRHVREGVHHGLEGNDVLNLF